VLEYAKTCGQFDPAKLAEIEKFLHDPAGWSKAMAACRRPPPSSRFKYVSYE